MYRIRRAGPRPLRASRHRIWRDPGEVEPLDLAGGPGGRDGAPVPPFTFLKEHADRIAAMRLGARRARPPLARQVGPRGQRRSLRRPPRIWPADILRRSRTSSPPARCSRRRACSRASDCIDRDERAVRRRAVRAGRSGRQQTVRRAQLGVERQPVRRHAGAERAEDSGHAAVQLGHQGSPRRRARLEHGDLRGSRTGGRRPWGRAKRGT